VLLVSDYLKKQLKSGTVKKSQSAFLQL